ncbi:MAG: ATP-binding protein [Clostridiales bacterium]|nr:ATP-binding protein [Clostridiales bacterium]
MSTWLSELLNIALVGLEFCIFFTLAGAFFPRRQKGWRFMLIASGFFIACYAVTQIYPFFALQQLVTMLIRQLVMLLIFATLSMLCYRAKAVPALVLSLAYLAILNLSDIIIIYGFTALTNQSVSDLASLPYAYCMVSYSGKLLELLIVVLLRVWGASHIQHKPQKIVNYLRFGIFPLASVISSLFMYIAAEKAPEIAPTLLFCVILLLVTDIGSILLLSLFEQQQQAAIENSILHRQLDTAMDSISATTKSYENERRLTHEFQNQIIVIRGMIEDGVNRNQIASYLDQVAHSTGTGSLAISTNRPAADALLNQKYLVAVQNGIDFQVRLDDLSCFPLPDNALVVLMSNLIDNTTEACEKDVLSKERRIAIKISVSSTDCILSVENTVAEPVEIHENMVATTKQNPERHGFGMKNIAAIVEAYDGYYTLQCDNNIFRFAAVFPGPQKERI